MDLIIVDFRSQFYGISALPIHVSGTKLGERGREGAGEKGGRPYTTSALLSRLRVFGGGLHGRHRVLFIPLFGLLHYY